MRRDLSLTSHQNQNIYFILCVASLPSRLEFLIEIYMKILQFWFCFLVSNHINIYFLFVYGMLCITLLPTTYFCDYLNYIILKEWNYRLILAMWLTHKRLCEVPCVIIYQVLKTLDTSPQKYFSSSLFFLQRWFYTPLFLIKQFRKETKSKNSNLLS